MSTRGKQERAEACAYSQGAPVLGAALPYSGCDDAVFDVCGYGRVIDEDDGSP